MTYALSIPTPPAVDISLLDDVGRKIAAKVWDLSAIQAAVAAQTLEVFAAPSANAGIEALNWGSSNLLGFIRALNSARYLDSEWCRFSPSSKIFPCDTYVMGYSRSGNSENQKVKPWIYFKFTVSKNGLLVIRAHEETARN